MQAGDTLETIGQQFGFTVAQMEAALELCVIGYEPGTFLQPFQTICLPGWTPACAYVWQASRCPACPSIPTCKYYVVQPGDTLQVIADALAIPLAALLRANPSLRLSSVLLIGHKVHLPPWGPECPKQCLERSEPCSGSAQCCTGLACAQELMAGRRNCRPCSAEEEACSAARPCCNKRHACVKARTGQMRYCRAL